MDDSKSEIILALPDFPGKFWKAPYDFMMIENEINPILKQHDNQTLEELEKNL